jgi:hypothetical protein
MMEFEEAPTPEAKSTAAKHSAWEASHLPRALQCRLQYVRRVRRGFANGALQTLAEQLDWFHKYNKEH